NAALDFLAAEGAALETLAGGFRLDQRRHRRVHRAAPGAGVVAVIAGAGFLAEAALFAETVRDIDIASGWIAAGGLLLAHAPGNVEAGHVGHGEGPHGEAEGFHGGVDLF